MGNVHWNPLRRFRSYLYDAFILKLSTKWYEVVLSRLNERSIVLDIGIGTAGALVKCKDILLERQIRVVGIDYDPDYIAKAKETIRHAGLDHLVIVVEMCVYQLDVQHLVKKAMSLGVNRESMFGSLDANRFNAAYFSGSFSLLPDLPCALNVVRPLLQERHGQIFITQTYQRYSPPFLIYIKPLLMYITTIDFGKLITEKEAATFFHETVPIECSLECVEHNVIKGSVDSFLQAAYLTILQPDAYNQLAYRSDKIH